MNKQSLKQAVDDMCCMRDMVAHPDNLQFIDKAITSLRQAIAEAEKQEPVIDKSAAIRIATALGWEPKREWVGLTDEEIRLIDPDGYAEGFPQQIQQALKQKNGYTKENT